MSVQLLLVCCCGTPAEPCPSCTNGTNAFPTPATINVSFSGVTIRSGTVVTEEACFRFGNGEVTVSVLGSLGTYCLRQDPRPGWSCRYFGYICGDVTVTFTNVDSGRTVTVDCFLIDVEILTSGARVRVYLPAGGFTTTLTDYQGLWLFEYEDATPANVSPCRLVENVPNVYTSADDFDDDPIIAGVDGTATINGEAECVEELTQENPYECECDTDGRSFTLAGSDDPDDNGPYTLVSTGPCSWAGFGGAGGTSGMTLTKGDGVEYVQTGAGDFMRLCGTEGAWIPCGPEGTSLS